MALFTAETAVLAAKKSHAPDSARNRKPDPPQPATIPAEVEGRAREVIELCQEQIALTHEALQDSKLKPADRSKLLVALDRLLERERVWSQRAGPGQLRPVEPGRRQARYWEKPVTMTPISSVPQAKPEPGSTGSGQP